MMYWWYLLQAVAGVATIVFLVDAGISKDEPYLVKLAFVGAFVITWLLSKVLDLWEKLIVAREEARRNRSAATETDATLRASSKLLDHTIRD